MDKFGPTRSYLNHIVGTQKPSLFCKLTSKFCQWSRTGMGKNSSWQSKELPCHMAGPSAPFVGLPWFIPTAKPNLQILYRRRLSKHLSNNPTITAAIQGTGSQITQLWELMGLDIYDFPRTTQNIEVILFEHASNSSNCFSSGSAQTEKAKLTSSQFLPERGEAAHLTS